MKTRLTTFIAAAAVTLLPVASASAHPADAAEHLDRVSPATERALGGEVEATPSGLLRVDLDRGGDLLTHGADPRPATGAEAGNATAGFTAGSPERAPVCVNGQSYNQHVIYARLASQPSNYGAVKSDLQAAIRRMNFVLNGESRASGGPTADYRVLCDSNKQIIVDEVTVQGTTFNEVVSAVRAAGHISTLADYTVFVDGNDPTGAFCGFGSIWNDDSLSAENRNNNGGTTPAASYGITYRSCWNSATPMHENGHNQGAVQPSAPRSTGTGWHCWDEYDVMCYSPDGGSLHQQGVEVLCTDREYFDCGYNDYFDSNPEAGEYLSNHWNMGSTLNRFIAFGVGDGEVPTASFTHSCTNLVCQFTSTSSDDSGIQEYAWTFGETGGASQASLSQTFPGPGTYQVSLSVRDGRAQWDDVTVPVSVTEPVKTLTSGVPAADKIGARGAMKPYRIKVPQGSSRLRVVVDGPDCRYLSGPCEPDLDLYLRRGSEPTRAEFDCRSKSVGADEVCTMRSPGRGGWRIGVDNAYARPGVDYTITATVKG